MESEPTLSLTPAALESGKTDDGNESNGFFKVLRRDGEELGLLKGLLCRLSEKNCLDGGGHHAQWRAEWYRARIGNPGREELQRLGEVQSQGARVWSLLPAWRHGCGETRREGGHCYLVTKESHTIVLLSALERVGACIYQRD